MKKITIDPHNCSREEYQELLNYLEENCWDYSQEEKEEEILYVLGDNSINGIKINEEIFNEEKFRYTIIDRSDFIDTLIGWIAEATQSKELMKQDLFMLQEWNDDYIFSSILTNEYIRQGDAEFDELCEELLKLNEETV